MSFNFEENYWKAVKRISELESQLAACKIARDGFTAASDTAHARVIELEAANAALAVSRSTDST